MLPLTAPPGHPNAPRAMPKTMFNKIWDSRTVADLGGGWSLLHLDRVLIHDLSGGRAMAELEQRGRGVALPDHVFATPDHAVSSAPGRTADTFAQGGQLVASLRRRAAAQGVRLFDLGSRGHGIVHVMGPELGITLPGTVLVCGDSHTCTHGGLGALAFGIGASELAHALATQTLPQVRPRTWRVRFAGARPRGIAAKDMILHAIGRFGAAAGTGYAVEYAGEAVRALSVEERLTLCNLSIEMGAKVGMVAPDDAAFDYLSGRDFSPRGALWDAALAEWRALPSDGAARFERDDAIAAAEIAAQITWGTSPEQVAPVTGAVPADAPRAALDHMGLAPGQRLAGTRVDWVFYQPALPLTDGNDLRRSRMASGGWGQWPPPPEASCLP